MHGLAKDRAAGLLLFLPVPLVLFLFTRLPLGVAASLLLGTAIMVSHRLYARPFSLARAARRCLWCGGAASGPELPVEEPLGATRWRACGEDHALRATRVLLWAERRAALLKAGILGTLGLFLLATPLAQWGRLGFVTPADTVGFFRLGIALTVLPLGLLAASTGPGADRAPRPPFPVHIQALIGTWAVTCLFRVVGVVWLALGALHFARRAGLG